MVNNIRKGNKKDKTLMRIKNIANSKMKDTRRKRN